MPKKTYFATLRVAYVEHWEVDAESEAEARQKINDLTEDVVTDEAGEVVDWEISTIKPEVGQ